MAFFGKTKTEKQLEQLRSILENSFKNVKQDTHNISEWITFLHKKNQEQEHLINSLHKQLDQMPNTRHEIKQIIDHHYSYENLHKKIQDLNERIDSLVGLKNIPEELEELRAQIADLPKTHTPAPHQVQERLDHIHNRLEKIEAKKYSFKEKLVQKIAKRSKEYVKSVIISYIRKYNKISGLQLKEMVVDEQALCSKSSFYRMLTEIEVLEDISVIQQGKEKHYLFKIPNQRL